MSDIGHLGLGLSFGDVVEVTHGGETLRIKLARSATTGVHCRLIFEGPQSFRMLRANAVKKNLRAEDDAIRAGLPGTTPPPPRPLSRALARAVEEAERRDRSGPLDH